MNVALRQGNSSINAPEKEKFSAHSAALQRVALLRQIIIIMFSAQHSSVTNFLNECLESLVQVHVKAGDKEFTECTSLTKAILSLAC